MGNRPEMILSNPFTRSFLAGSVWFIAIGLKLVSRHPGPWTTFPPRNLVPLIFGWVITALLLGTAARRFERLRSWGWIALGTVAGWFAVLGLMLVTMDATNGRSSAPKFSNTDEMMVYLANEATKWVKVDRSIDLDYSFESIKTIEEELARLSKDVDKVNPQKGTFGTASGYGAYIGEVIRRRDGGKWAVDHPTAGQQTFPLSIGSNTVIFPVGWCWKRLTGVEDENVYQKALLYSQATNALSGVPGGR